MVGEEPAARITPMAILAGPGEVRAAVEAVGVAHMERVMAEPAEPAVVER